MSVFFAEFFLETVPPHFAVFQSSVCLRFFCQRIFRNELWNGSPGFFGVFVPKMPFCGPQTARIKVLPVLGFFRSSIFVFFPEGFGLQAPCCVMAAFSLVLGVRFCMALLIRIRESFLRRFRAFGAVVSGSVSSSLLFLLLLPPFLLSGPAWVLFLFFCVPAARTAAPGRGRSVRSTLAFCLFFLFSLPGSAPLSLALSLSLFLSLSLSSLRNSL